MAEEPQGITCEKQMHRTWKSSKRTKLRDEPISAWRSGGVMKGRESSSYLITTDDLRATGDLASLHFM